MRKKSGRISKTLLNLVARNEKWLKIQNVRWRKEDDDMEWMKGPAAKVNINFRFFFFFFGLMSCYLLRKRSSQHLENK